MVRDILQKYHLDQQTAVYRVLLLFAVALFLAASYAMAELLKPFVLAVFLAYGLSPITERLERRGVNSTLAILITLASIVGLLALIVSFVYANISSFASSKRLDEYIARFDQLYEGAKNQAVAWGLLRPKQTFNQDAIQNAIAAGKSTIIDALTSTTNFLGQSFLSLFYLVLLLPGIKSFRVKVFRAFDRRRATKINAVNEKILTQVQEYITQKTLLSLGLGLAVYLLCLAFGIDLAIVWGVLTFLLNFIPTIGALLATALPIGVSILQPGASTAGIVGFCAGMVVIQFVSGSIVEPRVFSGKFSLSTLVVFGGLVFWGWLWGIVGVVLSVPIMVIVSILCRNVPSLRPIGVFLQSASPIREDEERLSLIAHVALADRVLQPTELRHIEAELHKEIYQPKSIRKVWRIVQRKPIPLELILREKTTLEKLQLYQLACRIALLNDEVSEAERRCLHKMQTLAALAPAAIENIHWIARREKGRDDDVLDVRPGLTSDAPEESIAHSHRMRARKHLERGELVQARSRYLQALRLFAVLDDPSGTIDCSSALSVIDLLETSSPGLSGEGA